MSSITKIIITLAITILTSINTLQAAPLEDKKLRVTIAKETDLFYRKVGVNRGWEYYMPFVNSSYRVSKNFPGYPAIDNKDRLLKAYCMGSNESYLKYNFINVNIPGVRYASGRVKRFSLDYTWVGLNEENVKWTYSVAKDIQAKQPVANRAMTKKAREIINNDGVKIPKSLPLRKIDLRDASLALNQYKQLVAKGYTPDKINSIIKISFKENTADELDSALIYRMLVELDRSTRGWNYNLQNEELYKWLTQRVP